MEPHIDAAPLQAHGFLERVRKLAVWYEVPILSGSHRSLYFTLSEELRCVTSLKELREQLRQFQRLQLVYQRERLSKHGELLDVSL